MDGSYEKTVAENLVWEGETTDDYHMYAGKRRRLILRDHEQGIWHRDVPCEVI